MFFYFFSRKEKHAKQAYSHQVSRKPDARAAGAPPGDPRTHRRPRGRDGGFYTVLHRARLQNFVKRTGFFFFCIRRKRFEVSLDSEPLPRLSADGAGRSPWRSRGSADARALRGQRARGSRLTTSRDGREVLSAAFEVFARFGSTLLTFELTFLRPLSWYNLFLRTHQLLMNFWK